MWATHIGITLGRGTALEDLALGIDGLEGLAVSQAVATCRLGHDGAEQIDEGKGSDGIFSS